MGELTPAGVIYNVIRVYYSNGCIHLVKRTYTS